MMAVRCRRCDRLGVPSDYKRDDAWTCPGCGKILLRVGGD